MKYLLKLQVAFFIFFAFPILSYATEKINTPASSEKRLALVIGNASYPESPLRNPVNDATDMAIALRKLGFDVIEKTNATQKETNLAIAQFGEKITSDTVALFYYAGHGLQVKGKNYIVPVDAKITSEASIRAMTVDLDTITDQVAASKISILILDACRNNPFERRFRGAPGGLAPMEAPKGTFIAYATSPGKVAADGEGRNGLYTAELLKHMKIPNLTLETVFKSVRNNVMKKTGESQTPWESSSLTGDFFFNPTLQNYLTDSQTLQNNLGRSPELIEDETWDTIKNSNKIELFQAYLEEYPNGRYASQAKIRIVALKPGTKPSSSTSNNSSPTTDSPPSAEDLAWFQVGKNPGEKVYLDFLKKFPNGKYAGLANAELLRYKPVDTSSSAPASVPAQLTSTSLLEYPKKIKGYWYGGGINGGIEMWNIRAIGEKITGELIAWNPICAKKDTFTGFLSNSVLTFEQAGNCPGIRGTLKLSNNQPPFEFEGAGTAQGHRLTFKLKAVN